MKKSVLFIIILLSLSFISAGVCNYTIQGAHGVEIEGWCYDCSETPDGICPEDFGLEDCTADGGVEDADCLGPEIPVFYWSSLGDIDTQINSLNINMDEGMAIKAIGKNTGLSGSVDIKVYERDGGFDEDLGTITGSVTEGVLIGVYNITDEENITGGEGGEDFYTLYFEVNGEESNDLQVTFDYLIEETGVCGDYTNETECNEDIDGVANNSIDTSPEEREPGCFYLKWGECTWENDGCMQVTNEKEEDNNPSECADANVACKYVEEARIGSCDAGDDFFKVVYNSSEVECESWTSNAIPCPRQLRVPFFGFYGFIISLLIIGLVYFLNKDL